MTIHNLASGSAANSCLVTFGDTTIMIDAGLGAREAFPRMLAAGVEPDSLAAVICTHSHGDHIQGLSGPKGIAASLRLPIYMSTGAFTKWNPGEGWRPKLNLFEVGASFEVRGVKVQTFEVLHDSPSAGFVLTHGGERFAIFLDCSGITPEIEANVRGADVLMLEMNHDVDMLMAVPESDYPAKVKQRILGAHLSNEKVAAFLREDLCGTSLVILGHLSQVANRENLARLTAEDALDGRAELQIAGPNGGLS